MKRYLFSSFLVLHFFSTTLVAQSNEKSEAELKERGIALFEAKNFSDAKPIFAQLLSLYPKDPEYNYKYGASVLMTEADKEKPLKYLLFAVSKPRVDIEAFYFLGKAYHLNYRFADAVKQYSKFKVQASSDEREEFEIERQIEMAKNGNKLLSRLNDVQVIEKQEIDLKDFYRIYDADLIDGKLISIPEEFQSKYDKKKGEKSIIYLPNNAKEVYFSSYGKKGENGRDIYKAIKLGNGEWSDPVSIGSSINTEFDEDYAFIRPDGRTLYFASKGHTSMGGYDIFRSVKDEVTGQWAEPENLNFAFSSADDDIMFVTDKEGITAYFTSNRSSEYGKVTVYKVLTKKAPAQLSVITGKFITENSSGNKNAKITVIDKGSKETIGVYETDEKGNYTIEIAENGGQYQFNIETTDDAPVHTGTVTIPKQDEFEVLGQELRLVGEGDEQQLVIKNIFDGTTAQNASTAGPQITSETIKLRSRLDVNYTEDKLDSLLASKGITNSGKGSGNATAQNIGTSNEKPSKEDVSPDDRSDAGTSNAPDNSADENLSGSNTQQLEASLELIEKEANKKLDDKQTLINKQYARGVELQKEADALFTEAENLESQGATADQVEAKKKEAGITALKSAYATQIAQAVEKSIDDDLQYLDEIGNSNAIIFSKLQNDELAEAELEVNNLKQNGSKLQTADEIIEDEIKKVEEKDQINEKRIITFNQKQRSFKNEEKQLQNIINDLEAEQETASAARKTELQSTIDATKLDLQDISYQKEAMEKDFLKAKLTESAIDLEKEELDEVSAFFNGNSTENNSANLTEEEKNSLITKLKSYRDQDVFAYTSTNQLYFDEVDLSEPANVTTADSEVETSGNTGNNNITDDLSGSNIVNAPLEPRGSSVSSTADPAVEVINLNNKYQEQMGEMEGIQDEDVRAARKLDVVNDWINELNNRKQSLQSQLSSGVGSTQQTQIEESIATINAEITEKTRLRSSIESELASRAADNVPVADVSEVNASTVVDDKFTNLSFNQEISPSSQASSQQLNKAKKALFEAGEIAKQEQTVRESAYSLPTAEQRTEAFTKANALKKASEQKQTEAAKEFGVFNLSEFRINQSKIRQVNNFDENASSSSLELGQLLAEEAENFFTTALEIRQNINEEDRLSKREVEYQKAYDYEILALSKQKEALEKLGLASGEITNNATAQRTNVSPASVAASANFVQVITDPEILAIKNANEAKTEGDKRVVEVTSLQAAIEELQTAQSNSTDQSTRDSLSARIETLQKERNEKMAVAAMLFERERQIKQGIVEPNTTGSSNLVTQTVRKAEIYNPVIIDTVDIADSRKQLILDAQRFKEFATNRQKLASQLQDAEVAYSRAEALAEENAQLRKEAIIKESSSNMIESPEEKERLIKSAQVITQQIEKNQKSIDSLNNIVKIKNFLVINLEKKDKEIISQLSETEQLEYIQLTADYVPPSLVTVTEGNSEFSEEVSGSGELIADETSQTTPDLNRLPVVSDETVETENNVDSIDVVEEQNPFGEGEDLAEVKSLSEVNNEDRSPNSTVNDVPESNQPNRNNATEIPDSRPVKLQEIDRIPQQVKQAIFITLEKDKSAYSESRPIPEKTTMPDGLVYKVQIGAFRKPVPQDLFKGFAPLMSEKASGGITRYTAGLFSTENSAIGARDEIRKLGYPDAFVVAFKNGERISITKARTESGIAIVDNNRPGNTSPVKPEKNATPALKETNTVKGNTSNLSPDFAAPEVEKVVNAETVEGLFFTVQIGVYSKPVKKGVFNYSDLNVVQVADNLIRYNVGLFKNQTQADELKNRLQNDIEDAFVAAYYNGKRVTLEEAAKLKNN